MKIALISCVKNKRDSISKAEDLYTSTLFKFQLSYAKKVADVIFILSAKYGLVPLDKILEPYELTLNKMSTKARFLWAKSVWKDLESRNLINKDNEFIFLAGSSYKEFLERAFISRNIKYADPLDGLPFGKRLQKLKQLI